jgi:hypothetical protein
MADSDITTEDTAFTDEEARNLLEQVQTCTPLISPELMGKMEEVFQSRGFGIDRRMCLAVATMGGDWFKSLETDRERAVTAASILNSAKDQAGKLQDVLNAIEGVQARLLIAIAARQDCREVCKEADALSA